MKIRTGLSEKGMSKLVAWCGEVLKSKYDPTTFAENFDVDYEHYTCYEIRGWHTKSDNPETFTLEDDSDFIMEDI